MKCKFCGNELVWVGSMRNGELECPVCIGVDPLQHPLGLPMELITPEQILASEQLQRYADYFKTIKEEDKAKRVEFDGDLTDYIT